MTYVSLGTSLAFCDARGSVLRARLLISRPKVAIAVCQTSVLETSSVLIGTQCSNIPNTKRNQRLGDQCQEDTAQAPTCLPMHTIPGPLDVTISSGSDFIDLIQVSATEAFHRLQDARTFQVLGCSWGVLQHSRGVASLQQGSALTFNVRKLKAFRDNVTRNLAPTVARGFLEAQRKWRAATTAASNHTERHTPAVTLATAAPAVSPPAPPPANSQRQQTLRQSPPGRHSSRSQKASSTAVPASTRSRSRSNAPAAASAATASADSPSPCRHNVTACLVGPSQAVAPVPTHPSSSSASCLPAAPAVMAAFDADLTGRLGNGAAWKAPPSITSGAGRRGRC